MQIEQPILTIAVPTFNRARYLRELLDCLIEQLPVTGNVELIISDNASSDDTDKVIGEFTERGLSFKYLRNEENIGSDANFRQCFEKASGKYVWVFGDDDLLVSGGLDKIVTLLTEGEYALVYVSPYWFRNNHVEERTSDRFGRFAQVLPGGLPFARKVGAMIGFLSSMIVNKNLYSAIPHKPLPQYDGTNLMQIGWICPLLSADAKNLLIWERLVAARAGNTSGWGVCRVFGTNFKQITDEAFENRAEIARALQAGTLQRWFPDVIMQARRGAAGQFTAEDTRAMLQPLYSSQWRYWIYVFPMIVLPVSLASVWFNASLFYRRLETVISVFLDSVFYKRNLIAPR